MGGAKYEIRERLHANFDTIGLFIAAKQYMKHDKYRNIGDTI